MQKTIFLFRHGEVEAKYQKKFRGRINCELSDSGKHMSEVNAQFLVTEKIDQVVTTGLKRTDYVGELAKSSGLPWVVDSRFREADFGEWEGKAWDEVQKKYPEEVKSYRENFLQHHFPGGESVSAIVKRINEAWKEWLLQDFKKIAIISHSTSNGCLMQDLTGKSIMDLGLQTIGSFHEIAISSEAKASVVKMNVVLY